MPPLSSPARSGVDFPHDNPPRSVTDPDGLITPRSRDFPRLLYKWHGFAEDGEPKFNLTLSVETAEAMETAKSDGWSLTVVREPPPKRPKAA